MQFIPRSLSTTPYHRQSHKYMINCKQKNQAQVQLLFNGSTQLFTISNKQAAAQEKCILFYSFLYLSHHHRISFLRMHVCEWTWTVNLSLSVFFIIMFRILAEENSVFYITELVRSTIITERFYVRLRLDWEVRGVVVSCILFPLYYFRYGGTVVNF